MKQNSGDGRDAVIQKRQVYYVSGFDTRGANFYHAFYRDQAALQDPINGSKLKLGPPLATSEHGVTWNIHAERDGQTTHTRYTFLAWDDLVRKLWPQSSAYAVGQVLWFYVRFFLCDGFRRSWRCSHRFMLALMAPLAYVAVSLVAAGLAGLGVALASHEKLLDWMPLRPELAVVLAVGVTGWSALRWGASARVLWLARGWSFIHHWGESNDAALTLRWRTLAQQIAADGPATEADEILLIGHSAGTMAVIAVLAELLALNEGQKLLPKLRIMTLGHVVPMLAFFPDAQAFRSQVNTVAYSNVPWLDFTAPADPICMTLTDPLVGSLGPDSGDSMGISHSRLPGQLPRVVVRSARFDRMFEAGIYRGLRKSAFRMHFQYLMATQLKVHNDFFSMTAGPKPLHDWMQPTQ